MSTTLIERLEAIIATGEVSRAGLARAAGLHPNSLRKLGQSDWNPTADTLGRLEKLIHRGGADVLVGPEGGLNDTELAQPARAGLRAVRLGLRILRADSAALSPLATVNLLWGDFR